MNACSIAIESLDESHFASLREALDTVAREKRFLVLTEAPPPHEAFAFYRHILAQDLPHFVAVDDGQVLGWCDMLPAFGQARAHVGTLGIGLVPAARHRGLGRRLMQAALAKGWTRGFTRIELTVRADNADAQALYERLGFAHEGTHRRAFCIDGVYFDSLAMALLHPGAGPAPASP
jgi:putative acetyltransferase